MAKASQAYFDNKGTFHKTPEEATTAAQPAVPLYHAGKVCDQCGCRNFFVREVTAECGQCNAVYQIPGQPKSEEKAA